MRAPARLHRAGTALRDRLARRRLTQAGPVRHRLVLGAALLLAACGATSTVRITVPRGASVSQVADSLARVGAIPSRLLFRTLARITGADRQLKPGVYEIPGGASMDDILRQLRAGRVMAVRFTVPEGRTLYDVAVLAAARLGLPPDSVIAAATDRARADSLAAGAPSLEGFLFPDTYQVPGDASARDLVALMTDGFRAVWDSTMDDRAAALGLSRLQAVTLASLVEGEARVDAERDTIAGVYYNRWKIGMPLQADPTVQYAIVQATGERKRRLFNRDYAFDSPYNTYRVPGFPPGPVNSPGRKSLEAALAPAAVRYKYFVAGPDGRHRFAVSYPEHQRNVAAMRRAWAEARAAVDEELGGEPPPSALPDRALQR